MHNKCIINAMLALGAATAVSASAIVDRGVTRYKANEFTSGDCAQGTASYEHTPAIPDVTMDDTTHSVYLAVPPWYFFSDKTADGGACTGDLLGSWSDESNPCVNLDERPGDSRRIRCVRWNTVDPSQHL